MHQVEKVMIHLMVLVSLIKLGTDTKRILLTGQHGDTGGGGTGNSLMDGLRTRNRIHTITKYSPSTCLNHAADLTMSAPTIKCFGTGGLDKHNVLQLLHPV